MAENRKWLCGMWPRTGVLCDMVICAAFPNSGVTSTLSSGLHGAMYQGRQSVLSRDVAFTAAAASYQNPFTCVKAIASQRWDVF